MSVLFLAKEKPFARDAAELVSRHIDKAEIIFGRTNEPFPPGLRDKKFDYVISYIPPWIVPGQVLDNAKIAAINFHPGPPEYPGIGCTNFAIYYGEKEFGISVHYMKEKVDSGDIILVDRFPVFNNDSLYSLTQRCYEHVYSAFKKLFPFIIEKRSLPRSTETWKRKPFTTKQLNELCRITLDMTEEEVRRRIKATTYPDMPGAFIEIFGYKFLYAQD